MSIVTGSVTAGFFEIGAVFSSARTHAFRAASRSLTWLSFKVPRSKPLVLWSYLMPKGAAHSGILFYPLPPFLTISRLPPQPRPSFEVFLSTHENFLLVATFQSNANRNHPTPEWVNPSEALEANRCSSYDSSQDRFLCSGAKSRLAGRIPDLLWDRSV